jgi:hypothetical protein
MQRKGVPMLYERAASQVPSLYVCPVENVSDIEPDIHDMIFNIEYH